MSNKKELIITSATQMIRDGGYSAFSFREVADDVGIKSSSVQHYFKRKEDLAAAVAHEYSNSFFNTLGTVIETQSPKQQFIHYSDVFIQSFTTSKRACLCGILTHESPSLPQPVINEVDTFIDKNIEWLKAAYAAKEDTNAPEDIEELAIISYTSMEGAMAVATLKDDVSWLTTTQRQLAKRLF